MTQLNRKAGLVGLSGIGLAGFLVLSACGVGSNGFTNSSTNTSASMVTSSTTVPRPADLQSELLTLSEVPSAWSVDTTSLGTSGATSSAPTPACLKNLAAFNGVGIINRAQVKFHGSSSGIPFFEEQVASFVPGSLEGRLPAYDQAIGACGPTTFRAAGRSFVGTVSALPFPTVGDESRAYQLNFSTCVCGQRVTIGVDIVVARKGDIAVVLVIADLNNPNLSTFQRLAAKALSKVTSSAYV
jgi:hypothetical protein